MAKKTRDPFGMIPSPEAIQAQLTDCLARAERLKLLLELSQRLRLPVTTANNLPIPSARKGVSVA